MVEFALFSGTALLHVLWKRLIWFGYVCSYANEGVRTACDERFPQIMEDVRKVIPLPPKKTREVGLPLTFLVIVVYFYVFRPSL